MNYNELLEKADLVGMSVDEYIENYNIDGEGKQNDLAETDPPANQNTETSAGESRSGDISLGSPEIDFQITADDLKFDEGDVVAKLNAKLSQYGLIAKESTSTNSFNAINIEKRKSKEDEKNFFQKVGSFPELAYKAVSDTLSSFNVGSDLSEDQLKENADAINQLVNQLGDTSYLAKAEAELGGKWNEFKEATTAVEKTEDELVEDYKKARLNKFEEIQTRYNNAAAQRQRNLENGREDERITYATMSDFSNQEEYDAYMAWERGDLIADPTEEDIQAFDLERKQAFADAKGEEFGNDLSISERQSLIALVDHKAVVLDNSIKGLTDLRILGENAAADATAIIDNFNSNPSLDNFEAATAAVKEVREIENAILDNANSLKNDIGEAEYIGLAMNVLKKDYNRLRQMRSVAKGMAADVWLLGAELDELMGISYEGEYDKAVALKRETMREAQGFQTNLTIDEVSSMKDAGRWIAGAATNLLPSLGLAATGTAALPLFFMTGAGGKLGEMAVAEEDAAMRLVKNAKYLEENPNIDELERAAIEMEMAEDAKTLNISDLQKFGVAGLYGAAEVIFERVGTMHLWKNLGKTAKTLKPTSIKQGMYAIGKTWGEGLKREGGSEWATTLTGNVGDILILGEDKNIFEGGLESFAQGGLMGVGMVSINTPRLVKEAVVGEIATRKESKRLKEIMQRISELTNMPINNVDLGSLGRFGNLTPEVRKMVEELTLEAGSIKDEILEGLGTKYTAEQLFEIGERNRNLRKIEREWSEITSNPNFTASQLKAFEVEYRAKYEKEAQKRDEILEDEISIAENLKEAGARTVNFDATSGYATYNIRMQTESLLRMNSEFGKLSASTIQSLNEKAKAELEKEGLEVTNESVKQKAREDYFKNKYRELIEKGRDNVLRYIENNKDKKINPPESFDGEGATENLIARAKELGYENIGELKKRLTSGRTEALNFGGYNLVHMPNAIANGRIGVFAHEVLHDEAELGIQSKTGNEAGQDLLNYLEKKQPDLFARVKDRLDRNYVETDESTGESKKNKYYQEEALTALSDLLADGYMPDANTLEQVKLLLSKVLPGKFKLSDDAAVYQFVLDYNKAAHFGGKAKSSKSFIRAVGKEPENKEGKESRTQSAEAAKAVLDKISSNMDFFDPNSQVIARVLPGMIQAQLSKLSAKGLQFDMDEANSDIIYRLYSNGDINKFDGRGTLYGFINGRISFRIKDMLKASGEGKNDIVEDFNQSDIEDLKGVSANVTTVEQIEERTEAERPTYKPLLDSRITTPELLEAMESKIPRIVATAKNRIDAPVSKNTTVTPFVNEVRLALGKQLDIDLKKAMGGKKDGQLRKWLVSNKKAMLENMTTTYLMSAFPAAVQKKVNGVWTSDWKGKKIDRETTAVDKAGRTSGAEMVRRLPNASIKIDDKTFLSFVLDETGNPIRGKKESIAKAVAEEMAIEYINQQMQDANSNIRQVLEANQERLGYEIIDNHVQKLALDFERGNVKFSNGNGLTRTQIRQEDVRVALRAGLTVLTSEEYDRDISAMEDENVKGTFSPEVLEKLNKFAYVREKVNGKQIQRDVDISNVPFDAIYNTLKDITDKGLLDYVMQSEFKNLISRSRLDIFDETFLKEYSSLAALDKAIKEGDANAVAEKATYESEVADFALGVDPLAIEAFGTAAALGSKNTSGYNVFGAGKIEEAAKKDPGTRDSRNAPLWEIPLIAKEHVLKKISHYTNNSTSEKKLINRVVKAQRGKGTAGETADSGLMQDIQEANIANRKLVKYMAAKLIIAVKEGRLSEKNLMRLLQDMNANKKGVGFRSLGQLIYISGSIAGVTKGRPYVEHVYPNSSVAFDIISLAADNTFTLKDDGSLSDEAENALDQILDKNTLWATDNVTAATVDVFSTTNRSGIQRMEVFNTTAQDQIFVTTLNEDGSIQTLKDHLQNKEEVEKYKKAIGLKWSQSTKAKDIIRSSAKFSMAKPVAVFMVGGPGSGKSSTLKSLGLIDKGFRLVNQDPYLEKYIKEAGLASDEKTYNKEERSLRAKLGWKARKAAEEDLARNTAGRESMVVDGTGASYKATTKKMKALEDAGFEIHMVHVNTSKDVAVKRNRARAERSLADFIVTKTWDSVQESAKQYKEDYAGRFYEVNTDNLSYGEALPEAFVNQVTTGLEASGVKFSQGLSEELNKMIERTKGVDASKIYSKAQARMMGEGKGKYRLFVPASAEDFRGLTSYTFAGKGKQGEADQKFIEDNLITPYTRGVAMIEAIKQQVRRELNALRKADKKLFKMLGKKITNSDYTYDHALRVYMWTQQGIEVPNMNKDDIRFLINAINAMPQLIELGNAMQLISRQDTWMEPGDHWLSRTLVSDLNGMTEKVGRKKYLQEFIENSQVIFSAENLNKIEAIYGTRHREAIEDSLFAMSNGTNRTTGPNKQVNSWLNWVNNSTGAIMFFNRRSAVLQTLSSTNFINWSDNNPLKVAAAFANQPQYWSDFAMIFNSDKLKQRRSGLQTDVNQAEIANEARGAKNKAGAVIAYLLKIGFTPTQIADSFAIAAGGSSFYRNRVNTYLKDGMKQEAAEKQAFEDFSKTADEAQQSSDPYLVSQEQRSVLGRLVLAFQNTPMQYTRLMKKSMQDLANRRGDPKTHISKIIYYGAVQNFIFSALQSALFAVIPGFDDEEESEMTEKELKKLERKNDQRTLRIINSMTDSVLKGSGVRGAVIATLKNTITEYFKQEEKGFTADHTYTILQALSLSPPIGSKARKLYSAIQTKKFERDVLTARGFDVTADGKLNLGPAYSIIGSLASATVNLPLDRVVDELNSIVEALDSRNTTWQRIALALGWKTWDVGAKNEENDLIKTEAKAKRKEEGKAKAKKTREENKKKEEAEFKALTPAEKYLERKRKAEAKKNK
jgi:chloramphenicol 3-O-phosphotransferase